MHLPRVLHFNSRAIYFHIGHIYMHTSNPHGQLESLNNSCLRLGDLITGNSKVCRARLGLPLGLCWSANMAHKWAGALSQLLPTTSLYSVFKFVYPNAFRATGPFTGASMRRDTEQLFGTITSEQNQAARHTWTRPGKVWARTQTTLDLRNRISAGKGRFGTKKALWK